MNKEDKSLLYIDLCARLPYGVICQMEDKLIINDSPFYNHTLSERHIELFRKHKGFYIKPYLRPMSSMTEAERHIFDTMTRGYTIHQQAVLFDWLNKKIFDYRGFISKDLALEAHKDMYKID